MQNSKSTRIIKLITVCATLVLCILVGVVIFQLTKIKNLENKAEAIDIKSSELSQKREDLKKNIATQSSDTFVEYYARDYLGMLKDGDIIFIVK